MDVAPRDGLGRRGFLRVACAAAVGSVAAACAPASREGSTPASPSPSSTSTSPGRRPVAERLLPGDPDWRVRRRGPDEAIEGYGDRASVLPGESFGLHVSTAEGRYRVTAYRMGWYGGTLARRVWRSGWMRGRDQGRGRLAGDTRTVRAGWRRSLTVSTEGWPEGAYLLRLDTERGHQRHVPLVVRSASGAGRTVLVHATPTWQAYNRWGGYSLYYGDDGRYESRSLAVSFDRPYDSIGMEKFLIHERPVVALAERLGLPLAYTTGGDLEAGDDVLTGATSVIFLGHDEYWTPGVRRTVTEARDAGANLAFLGANTCYRRVRMEEDGRLVVCYKTAVDRDPLLRTRPSLATTDFRAAPKADPESSLIGVYYDGYPVDAPFVVHEPRHWIFAGSGVRRGDAFPHLVGVEYDRVNTDVPTPRPLQILAHSPVTCVGRPSFADAAYYTVPSGAGVFASGTMRWAETLMARTRDLPRAHGIDARTRAFVTTATTNLLKGFAEGPAAERLPTPDDNVRRTYRA
ncbi:N,N-dimethylformamidase beta subunit family domain-containing protein [Microbispora sp. NBRC 16548]|uniref:N,N-dimethylformamidase beta subunit family domain-containing protein n=1 Tax=Microbispora sp. NBRC 16548 TaxID=3030994 RepID=UPI0025556FA3|nr:N,N-dimethylformamidase beta subunit family domain-containing protein [Microbispora sp. NBRC 16548]